jgi:uncharacterized membrane protein YGL010W
VRVEPYFVAYQTYHRHRLNKLTHYVGIPLIVYAILNLLYQIPPLRVGDWPVDFALLFTLALIGFYLVLSVRLALAMAVLTAPVYVLATLTPWPVGLAAFVVGWIFQFLGHHVEGKKPAFLTNGLHLLIGPLWIVSHLLEKLHLWAPRPVQAAPQG